uniref:Uncharacterized protein n=1 Tax=Candidatus Nitrotoga fabula TaxID=2182327 RepID=A0A2X0QR44_9PROT|nr:protein of unknown function [Candidatus Nitrotoga fabula]
MGSLTWLKRCALLVKPLLEFIIFHRLNLTEFTTLVKLTQPAEWQIERLLN